MKTHFIKTLAFVAFSLSCSAKDAVMISYSQYTAIQAAVDAIKKTEQYQERQWSFDAYDIKIELLSSGCVIWFTPPASAVRRKQDGSLIVKFGSSYSDDYPALVVDYDVNKAAVTRVGLQR